ncbi:hypothetical protein CBL_13777 [Carabus blaptoides fortunei]
MQSAPTSIGHLRHSQQCVMLTQSDRISRNLTISGTVDVESPRDKNTGCHATTSVSVCAEEEQPRTDRSTNGVAWSTERARREILKIEKASSLLWSTCCLTSTHGTLREHPSADSSGPIDTSCLIPEKHTYTRLCFNFSIREP